MTASSQKWRKQRNFKKFLAQENKFSLCLKQQWLEEGSKATELCVVLGVNNNDRFNLNANDNVNNQRPARGMACLQCRGFMITYNNLWQKVYSYDNLMLAYESAKKHKTANPKVQEFSKNLQINLLQLMHELYAKTYKPVPLQKFVLRDPKTRVICVSDFRDRVVHHALVNVLKPIFEPRFIYDSYASRKGKGTLAALSRFETFMRKVTENGRKIPLARNANSVVGYVLKADIKKYFENVSHGVLLNIIANRVRDENVLWLVKAILGNYHSYEIGKGMQKNAILHFLHKKSKISLCH